MNFELTDDQARRLIRAASVYARDLASSDRPNALALDEARHIMERTVDGLIDKPRDSYGPLGTAQQERDRLIAALTQLDYLQNQLDAATRDVGPQPVVLNPVGPQPAVLPAEDDPLWDRLAATKTKKIAKKPAAKKPTRKLPAADDVTPSV